MSIKEERIRAKVDKINQNVEIMMKNQIKLSEDINEIKNILKSLNKN